MNLKTQNIIICGLFASITAVLSQISIPLPFTIVPLTMQIFSVALTGLILGSKKGLISIIIYLLLGAIGVPVFAQMSGGLGILMGPTGGFLLGCPLMAFVVGYVSERSSSKLYILLSMVLGLSVVYITGTIMFSVVTKSTIQESILACVAPFVVVDLIKLFLATSIEISISKRVNIGVKSC